MALADEARRVAAEFEYPKEEVNRGVKEFLRQMDEGLQKDGTSMSQIPTYVTAVPNGTEKVLPLSRNAYTILLHEQKYQWLGKS